MKKFFHKDPVMFAVAWIGVYVIGFSTADGVSQTLGIPPLITVAFGLLLSAVLLGFSRKNSLGAYLGLCKPVRPASAFLLYLPLAAISSVNLWFGLKTVSLPQALVQVLCMCLVGFLEELIFRGLLFKGMLKTNVKAAFIVSSVTFGVGHIINLLGGAPVFDTLLQIVDAFAVGLCYTALFYTGGSILPCILSHALHNSLNVFSAPPPPQGRLFITLFLVVTAGAYTLWLLRDPGE